MGVPNKKMIMIVSFFYDQKFGSWLKFLKNSAVVTCRLGGSNCGPLAGESGTLPSDHLGIDITNGTVIRQLLGNRMFSGHRLAVILQYQAAIILS